MVTILLIVLALTLLIMAYKFKRPSLGIAGSIAWLLFGLYSLTLSTVTWDIYYDLFVLGMGLFIMALIESMMLRPKTEEEAPEEDVWGKARSEYLERKQQQNERLQEFRVMMGRRRTDKQRERDDDFAETGRF